MIIKIECDADIKHLSIDFGESGEKVTTLVNYGGEKITTGTNKQKSAKNTKLNNDKPLNLDEDYSVSTEIVEKPVIEEVQREVSVSDEMQNATF